MVPRRRRFVRGLAAGGLVVASLVSSCAPSPPAEDVDGARIPASARERSSGTVGASRCELRSRPCVARSGTRARIAHTEVTFAPPVGWSYVESERFTITYPDDTAAALVFAPRDHGSLIEDYRALADALGVTATEELTPRLERADDQDELWRTPLRAWQAEGAVRDGESGFLVFFARAPASSQARSRRNPRSNPSSLR